MSASMSFGSFNVNLTSFGFNSASLTSTVMGGFSQAGSVGGAQILSFASSFQVGNMQANFSATFTSGFPLEPAPLPQPALELSGAPAGKGLSKDPAGWPKGSVRTAGGYTIVPEGKSAGWKIFNPGQKPTDKASTRVWGDPHVNEKDGGRWDFTKTSDFTLPDGTKITAKTTSEKGYAVTKGLEITNGADRVSIDGINGRSPKTSGVKHDGYEFRATQNSLHPNRPEFKLGGDGDDWFMVKNGKMGEIKGAHMDKGTGAYEQHVDGKGYRIDPNLRPPFGSAAWGNMLRDNTLDFITGKLGLDPATAALVGGAFHSDHVLSQIFGGGYQPQVSGAVQMPAGSGANQAEYLSLLWASMQNQASPPGLFGGMGGMAFGLPGGMKALGGMAKLLNGMNSLGKMANLAQALAGAGGGFMPQLPIGIMPPGGRPPILGGGPVISILPPSLPPQRPGYFDASAGAALEGLRNKPGMISGDDMMKAIIAGTADLDGQAAGAEFADFKNFAKQNWARMTPDAKAKFAVYERHAQKAQARGQTGIPIADYARMIQQMAKADYKDQGAGTAIESLKQQPQPITGAAMEKAIIDGTKDLDGQAAGKEFADFQKFAKQNWANMSSEARAKYEVYAKYAGQAQAKGQTGIKMSDYSQMKAEMRQVSYQDASSGAAVEKLRNAAKPISGADMEKAIIDGTKDLDGQAAGKEFADISAYAKQNWDQLSPDAKAKFGVYEKYAKQAQAKGQTGIKVGDYAKMTAEMKTAGYQDQGAGAAIEGLKQQQKPISGAAMEKAIIDGTKDFDAQAAGKEFADFQKFAKQNWNDMSPEAQAKYKVYEKHAQANQAKGNTGIPLAEYNQMKTEMRTAGYKDAGAGAAIENLKQQPQPISGAAMEKAIIDGTKDLDGQAAGKEFADFQNFAKANWDKLSPDAKAKYEVYSKYAGQAQAKGQSGIALVDYAKMTAEMKTAGYQDRGAGAAIENLKQQPQPISGAALEQAIVDGTKDFDGQAAGAEYNDLNKYVKANWDNLSPDAKAKWGVYEKHAQANRFFGSSGIGAGEYQQMRAEMSAAGYRDQSAGAAIENLKQQPQPISGAAFERALISGTADLDGQAAGAEYADFANYVRDNYDNLSPEAQGKWSVYQRYVDAAQARGFSGIPVTEYASMLAEMKRFKE